MARCISLASKWRTRSIRGRGLFGGRELFEEIRYMHVVLYSLNGGDVMIGGGGGGGGEE